MSRSNCCAVPCNEGFLRSEAGSGPLGWGVRRGTGYWDACRVRRKTDQAPGSRGPKGFPVAGRGRDKSVGEVSRASPSSALLVGLLVLALDEANERPLSRRRGDRSPEWRSKQGLGGRSERYKRTNDVRQKDG